MPLFAIPLVFLITAILLINLVRSERAFPAARVITVVTGVINIVLVFISIHSGPVLPVEYLFSPLFTLPGMSETLSFSLFADLLSIQWLTLMILSALCLAVLAFFDSSPNLILHLSILNLSEAGLSAFILSGSPITGVIGWGTTFAALLIATNFPETDSRDIGSRDSPSHPVSNFTVLMFPVLLMLAAAFLLYSVNGILAYSNDPGSLELLVRALLGVPHNPLVLRVLTLISLALLFSVLPAMGLVPFISWLSDTRRMHPLTAVFTYSMVMPAGILFLQRFRWILEFTPAISILALTLSLLTLLMAIFAVLHLNNGRLLLIWLAAACSSMLLSIQFLAPMPAVPLMMKIVYPGLFVFSFGFLLDYMYRHPAGRSVQMAGMILPCLTAAVQILTGRAESIPLKLTAVLPGMVFIGLAFRIFRTSNQPNEEAEPFTSSWGWSAYRFYGFRTFVRYLFSWPIQQLADGFLVLESGLALFWNHGLSGMIRSWSRLLWLFDRWFIDGMTRWMKPVRPDDLRKPGKNGYIVLSLIGIPAISMICKVIVLWI